MSIFAQRKLKPDDVMPEWRRTLEALGNEEDVERFVRLAAKHLEAPLEPSRSAWRFPIQHLPEALRDRLAAEGLAGPLHLDLHLPTQAGARFVHRTHPLVSVLADTVLESVLDPAGAGQIGARSAAVFTRAVSTVTTLWLLRVRTRITVTRRQSERVILAEEGITLAGSGDRLERISQEDATRLLAAEPAASMADGVRVRHVRRALEQVERLAPRFEEAAREQAAALLEDHRRVRRASEATGRYRVEPVLPVDVMGVYVLVPYHGA
jgi:hypothetical protein